MAGQVYQLRAFICGIEVPVSNVQVSSSKDSIWAASITMPWSPFMNKLPKGTKVTVFRRNTDIFDHMDDPKIPSTPYKHFRLMFDGVIVGIMEAKAYQGQAIITLDIQADASIYQWRKRNISPIEMSLSKDSLGNAANAGMDDSKIVTIASMNAVVPLTFAHLIGSNGKNATQTIAIFLTSTPDSQTPESSYGNENCNYVKQNNGKFIPSGFPPYDHMSPYMCRYYKTYMQCARVMYVDLPAMWKKALAEDDMWKMVTKQITTVQGMVSFWDCARYITNLFQGDMLTIPDATLVDYTVKSIDPKKFIPKQPWLHDGNHNSLGELIIMPKNIFGKIPYCNIILPDQVIQKQFKVNHNGETTRSFVSGDMVPEVTPNLNSGLLAFRAIGPTGLSKYFEDFNMKAVPKSVTSISNYEFYYGISPSICPLPEHFTRILEREKKKVDTEEDRKPSSQLMTVLTHEFMISYSQKFSISLVVTPDVEVVPGAPILIIDEDGEHIIAYCHGVTYAWDVNGRVSSQIQLAYPHHYSWDMTGAAHYGNPFSDDNEANSSYTKTYAAIIGSEVHPGSVKQLAIDYFNMWKMDYNRDSRRMKYANKKTKLLRDVCTLEEYVNFMGGNWEEVKSQPINLETGLTTLGTTLIKKFDTDEKAASMSFAFYDWFDPLMQKVKTAVATPPVYKDIGKPGEIIPSTYMSGIVNCHIKYLHQIGHFLSV